MKHIRNSLLPGAVLALTLAATGLSTGFAATDGKSPVIDEVIFIDIMTLSPNDQASKMIGSEIYTADNEKVGEVSDLILDGQHKVVAMTVGVGGFLGIDETVVSVPMQHMTISHEKNKLRISTDLTKADIENAAMKN